MKKSFTFLASLLALILCAGIYHFFLSPQEKQEEIPGPGETYVNQVLPLILADLTTDNFLKFASKELISSAPKEDFNLMFDWFSRLGSLKNCHDAEGEEGIIIFPDGREELTGEYTAKAEFEAGYALVHVLIIREENKEWKVNGMTIESKALMRE